MRFEDEGRGRLEQAESARHHANVIHHTAIARKLQII